MEQKRSLILYLIFAKCDSNCGLQKQMSAEGSLQRGGDEKDDKEKKGGENPAKKLQWGSYPKFKHKT